MIKVGDRVRALEPVGEARARRQEGVVIGATPDLLCVMFDNNIDGHDGMETISSIGRPIRGEAGHCWYLYESELQLLSRPDESEENSSEDEPITCAECGAVIEDPDESVVFRDKHYCDPDCAERSGVIQCADCGEWTYERYAREVVRVGPDRGNLNNYGYKPTPVFYKTEDETGSPVPLFMGVELEVDDGDDVAGLVDDLDYEEVYCKEDGSLGCDGVEIVTHPATLEYHMKEFPWPKITKTCLDYGYRSHDTDTCGLHVHVNRSFFGEGVEQELNIARLILMVNRFWDAYIVPFSRRNIDSLEKWANKNKLRILKEECEASISNKVKNSAGEGRYKAINLQNRNTIEFRIFRGTLKLSTLMATFQFVDTICRFAKVIPIDDIDTLQFEEIFRGANHKELTEYLETMVSEFDASKVVKVLVDAPKGDRAGRAASRESITEGSRVVIREWEDMELEYGINGGNIPVLFGFAPHMVHLCGRTATVRGRAHERIFLEFEGDTRNTNYSYSIDMVDLIEEVDAECA